MLNALSPLDGRYAAQTEPLAHFFSEQMLIHARLEVEVRYFLALSDEKKVKEVPKFAKKDKEALIRIVTDFDLKEAKKVKAFEKKTNHDVKAAEYYLKKKIADIKGVAPYAEFIHFGLTSEDVNNLAYGIIIHDAVKEVVIPELHLLITRLKHDAQKWKSVRMLSLTHGQPATPTTVGKELMVCVDRLNRQMHQLRLFRMQGKFGGAVGNYSAHLAAYPEVNWEAFGKSFVESLGLEPLKHSAQINPHDDLAELSHILQRINVILLDLSRDMWLYISRGVFKQKAVKGEVGSSAMPHKVNPIDFENAEGNLGLSNALFGHLAEKLPVSRLQRDLSDSTVQRNIGSAFGYHYLSVLALLKGWKKVEIDKDALKCELMRHPEVLAEAIQTLLRRKGTQGAYEKLKDLTRGKSVSLDDLKKCMCDVSFTEEEQKRVLDVLGA